MASTIENMKAGTERLADIPRPVPVMPTGLGELAPARVLALPEFSARLLGECKMPASNLGVSAVHRLRYRPPREAVANVLQYCAPP
jgi:hypothetical protein